MTAEITVAASLSCLIRATKPWVASSPQIPKHLHFKVAASRFGLRLDEGEIFDDLYTVYETAHAIEEAQKPAIDVELGQAFARLSTLLTAPSTRFSERGYRYVGRVAADRPYVIFSDHHIAYAGHRQDFFATSGNRELYGEVLSQYAAAAFTLVENGDVEELLVLEPTAPEAELRRALAQAGDVESPLGSSWQALDRHRLAFRRDQLARIIASNRALYSQIHEQFHQHGRYIRVAGNHDIDTQDGELLDTLRTAYPGLAVPLDFLVIEPAAGDTSAGPVVVAHGHHFDRQCTPLYARRLGETFSETLAWAFQGADRIWSWSGDNDVTEWAGGAPFRANLVSDDPAVWKGLDEVLLGAAMLASAGATLGVPMAAAVAAAGGDALVTRQLEDPALWESLFKHKISWEYFERPSAAENVFEEVLCGKEWFKFRHLDELFVSDGMRGLFPSQPGRLVLGHSHEPRHSALRGAGEPVLEYLNSGAAGRFENLLWCVEVVDGAAQVAAWHRPGGPRSADAPVRYVYQPTSRGADQLLSPTAIPLSVAALAPGVRWLEAVLHVAMR